MTQMTQNGPTPDERLQQAFATLFVSINKVETFRTTTTDLLAYGGKYFEEKIISMGKQEMSKPEFQEWIDAKPLNDLPALRDLILRMVAERSIRISSQVIDSAALVFAHAVLDNTLSECCCISSEAAPSDWSRFVEKRTVALEELKTATADDLRRLKVSQYIAQLDRESMNKRLDILHRVCAQKVKGELITAWIKHEDLEAFDSVRQKVVHAGGFAEPIKDVAEQILFAALVGACVLALVGMAHGLNAGGLLAKNPANKKELFAKAFAAVTKDFPQLDQQLEQWMKSLEHFNKLLAEMRNASEQRTQSESGGTQEQK